MYREDTFFLSSLLSWIPPETAPTQPSSAYPPPVIQPTPPWIYPTPVPSLCASLWQMGTVCDSRVIGSHPHGVGLSFCVSGCVIWPFAYTHVFVSYFFNACGCVWWGTCWQILVLFCFYICAIWFRFCISDLHVTVLRLLLCVQLSTVYVCVCVCER